MLQRIFSLRLRMCDANMTPLAKAALNNQTKLAATFNPLRLRNIGKAMARHTRAGAA